MNARETALAGATGIIVAGVLGWILGVRPMIERWQTARERVANLEDQLEKSKALVKRKGELLAERDRIEHALTVTEGDASDAFLAHLRDLTSAAGIEPKDLRQVRVDPFEAYAELHFELRGHAPFRKVQDFLVRMTASDSYLRIQAIQIAPHTDGDVDVDMSLVGLATQDALDEQQRKDLQKGRVK